MRARFERRMAMAKVLVVTGASRGIGAACAELAAADGWTVCVNYNGSAERAHEVVGRIRAKGGTAVAMQADVSREADVVRLFEQVDRELGPPGGLVNNAGTILPRGTILDVREDDLNRLWRINISSQMLCAREAVKRMSTKLGGKGGAIVNMSSVHSRIGAPGLFVSYAASKGAIDSFTKGLAQEVVGQGIRVTAIRPGLIDTELHGLGGDAGRAQSVGPSVPIGRAGTPEEVAEAVVWLLSDKARYVADAVLDVSGGR